MTGEDQRKKLKERQQRYVDRKKKIKRYLSMLSTIMSSVIGFAPLLDIGKLS
jgi:hypothetical protein